MNAFFRSLKDCLFPLSLTCDLCGRETFDGRNLCPDCLKTVAFNDGETCPVCGRRTRAPGLCMECKASAPAYDRAVSAIIYRDGGAGRPGRQREGVGSVRRILRRIFRRWFVLRRFHRQQSRTKLQRWGFICQ